MSPTSGPGGRESRIVAIRCDVKLQCSTTGFEQGAQDRLSLSSTVLFAVLRSDYFRLSCHCASRTELGRFELSLNSCRPRLVFA